MQRTRGCGELSPKWDVYVTPFPPRLRESWRKKRRKTKSQRWWLTRNRMFRTQQGRCTYALTAVTTTR